MQRRFLAAAIAALGALAASAGCRSEKKESAASCTVVERSVRQVGDALEVSIAVSWSVNGKNYRHNKQVSLARFDPREHPKAALEERYKPGAVVPCAIDPARPTRVDLSAP